MEQQIQKHPGGRPTKYEDSFIQIAKEYIESCGREATELPTIEGLARTLQVDSDTIVEWDKNNKEFSVTIKKLKDKQKQQLMNDGMYGGKEVNSTMAIFLLKANHGMIETSRQEITGENGGPLNITINAGSGYIPKRGSSTSAYEGSNTAITGTVQDDSVASKG